MTAKQVVIVDDTMSIGRFLQAAMMTLDSDLEISVVPSGEEALLEAGSRELDLIVTDLNLPGISGFDLAKKIRKKSQEIQLILITGMSDLPLEKYAREVNAAAYFTKPLDTDVFLETARKCLGLVPQQPETGPGEPAAAEKSGESLSTVLGDLRQRLNAIGVLLFDDRGRVVAQAGELPASDFEHQWIPPIMSLVSASDRVNWLVGGAGQSYESVSVHRGEKLSLVLAPLGLFALVLALKTNKKKPRRMIFAFEEVLEAQQELKEILSKMGINIQPVEGARTVLPEATSGAEEVEDAGGQEEADESITELDLDTLFDQPEESLETTEAEEFWESMSDSSTVSPTNPDVLSFDQARKLGLTPDE